jgi:hypothetical protein
MAWHPSALPFLVTHHHRLGRFANAAAPVGQLHIVANKAAFAGPAFAFSRCDAGRPKPSPLGQCLSWVNCGGSGTKEFRPGLSETAISLRLSAAPSAFGLLSAPSLPLRAAAGWAIDRHEETFPLCLDHWSRALNRRRNRQRPLGGRDRRVICGKNHSFAVMSLTDLIQRHR